VPVNAENMFLLFKERRPFKLKKEYPSEQWKIISFRLIPPKTPVSFRWTVPLKFTNVLTTKVNSPKTGKLKMMKRESMVSRYILYNTSTVFLFMHCSKKTVEEKVPACFFDKFFSSNVKFY
jgi:hypothetical protein